MNTLKHITVQGDSAEGVSPIARSEHVRVSEAAEDAAARAAIEKRAITSLKEAREEVLRRGISSDQHREIFDVYYGEGSWDALEADGMRPWGVKLASTALMYSFRGTNAEGHYDRNNQVEVLDAGANAQFKGADPRLMARAIAFMAEQKGWSQVKLDGSLEYVAHLQKILRDEYGIQSRTGVGQAAAPADPSGPAAPSGPGM